MFGEIYVLTGDWRRWTQHFTLKEGHEYVFGKAPDCNVVIARAGVAEKHAKVYTEDGTNVTIQNTCKENPTLLNGTELKGRAQLNDGDSFSIAYRAFVFRNAAYAKRREHPNPFGKGETSAAPDVNVSNVPEAAPKQDTQQQTVKPTAEQKTETKAEPTRGTQPAASTTTTKCAATPKDGKGSSKATKVLYNAFSSHVACSFNELNREREKALAAAARGEKVSRNNTLKPYCAALFQKIEPYGQIYYEAPGRRREKGAQPGLPEKRQKTQPIDS